MSYHKILAEDVYVYPSSNASDGGQVTSEENLTRISRMSTTRNFVIDSPGSNRRPLSISVNDGRVIVSAGKCCIEGYYIDLKSDQVVTDFSGATSPGMAYVAIYLVEDTAGHILSDGYDFTSEETKKINRGVRIALYQASPPINSLTLGTVQMTKGNDGAVVVDSLINDYSDKYTILDAKYVSYGDSLLESWLSDKYLVKGTYPSTLSQELCTDLTFRGSSAGAGTNIATLKSGSELKFFNSVGGDTTTVSRFRVETPRVVADEVEVSQSVRAGVVRLSRLYPKTGDTIILGLDESGSSTQKYKLKVRSNNDGFSELSSESLKFEGKDIRSDIPDSLSYESYSEMSRNTIKLYNTSLSSPSEPETIIKAGSILVTSSDSSGTITTDKLIAQSTYSSGNDYAEWYLKSDSSQEVIPGTVISKVRGKDEYVETSPDNADLVVGVVSDTYGFSVGESDETTHIPVAMSGRVSVRVKKGIEIEEGTLLRPSDTENGVAEPAENPFNYKGRIIGKSLESTDGTKDRILIQVFLG